MNVVVRSASEAVARLARSALVHDCNTGGCAMVVLEPKLRDFDHCFQDNVRMGDVDMSVERNGHILWGEWKSWLDYASFEKKYYAQLRQARAFTTNSLRQSFVLVVGCPRETKIERFQVMENGNWLWGGWVAGRGDKNPTERFCDYLKYWDRTALAAGRPK